ncbi:MAG TPA: urease accessory protein UreD [Aggregatilineales bacterium]|nr:urease accessory protein UreD [Aggregatilineales bacterium]
MEQTPPLKVIRAFEQESGGALVHLHNVSGGVLGGDSLAYEIDLDEHTEVQLTTTSATRIYRHRQGAPTAVQRMRIRVGQGALLEYLPDPIIPFANSRYRQATAIMLAQDAGLFWWESLAPGRTARDEVFAYEQLNLETLIRTEDRPIAIERLCLEPAARPLSSPLRMGNYRYLTTFYICKVGLEGSQWQALEGQLRALALERSRREEVLWGVSMLVAHGLAVRGLSVSGRSLAPGLLAFWQAAKTFLYGRAAVLPRKIY